MEMQKTMFSLLKRYFIIKRKSAKYLSNLKCQKRTKKNKKAFQ